MGLSQAELDLVAGEILAMYGSLLTQVTYAHRETAAVAPTVYGPFTVPIVRYSEHVAAMHALTVTERPQVLREDRRALFPTAMVTWGPTIYGEVILANGSRWRVLSPIIGGPGYPFYLFQIRSIPL